MRRLTALLAGLALSLPLVAHAATDTYQFQLPFQGASSSAASGFAALANTSINLPGDPYDLSLYKGGDLLIGMGNSVVRYNVDSGVVDQMVLPGAAITGVYWDSDLNQLLISNRNDGYIGIYSDLNGTLLGSRHVGAPYGITKVAGDYVYVTQAGSHSNINSFNGTDISSGIDNFTLCECRITGVTTDGTNLITINSQHNDIGVLNGVSASVQQVLSAPSSLGAGVLYDGTNLLSTDHGTRQLYIHDGITAWNPAP